jgi:uncharacterized repeat protein (TIGR01451 family)
MASFLFFWAWYAANEFSCQSNGVWQYIGSCGVWIGKGNKSIALPGDTVCIDTPGTGDLHVEAEQYFCISCSETDFLVSGPSEAGSNDQCLTDPVAWWDYTFVPIFYTSSGGQLDVTNAMWWGVFLNPRNLLSWLPMSYSWVWFNTPTPVININNIPVNLSDPSRLVRTYYSAVTWSSQTLTCDPADRCDPVYTLAIQSSPLPTVVEWWVVSANVLLFDLDGNVSVPAPANITFDWSIIWSEVSSEDFTTPMSGTEQIFAWNYANPLSIQINTFDDDLFEGWQFTFENYTFVLSNWTSLVKYVTTDAVSWSIEDNDPVPVITIVGSSELEWSSLDFTVSLSNPSQANIILSLSTSWWTAQGGGVDFVDIGWYEILIPWWTTSVDLPNLVQTIDDMLVEGDETVFLVATVLSGVATIGSLQPWVILNNDTANTPPTSNDAYQWPPILEDSFIWVTYILFEDVVDNDNWLAVHIGSVPTSWWLFLDNVVQDGIYNFGEQLIAPGDILTPNQATLYLTYRPYPNLGGFTDSFTFAVQDDGGTGWWWNDMSPYYTYEIPVLSVNDAPSGADTGVTMLEDGVYTLSVGIFWFTDPNDTPPHTMSWVRIASLPDKWLLTLNSVPVSTWQYISVAQLNNNWLTYSPTPNEYGSMYASFTFQVQDNGGTANGWVNLDPIPNTFSVNNVTSVNDAPRGTQNTVATSGDTAYVFTVTDFWFIDPDDVPADLMSGVMISSLPWMGTLYLSGVAVSSGQYISVNAIESGLFTFLPVPATSGPWYTTFQFRVQDTGGTASGGVDLDAFPRTMTIDVLEWCGNGVQEGIEQCDDGNQISGDGCSSSCTIEIPACGSWAMQYYYFPLTPATGDLCMTGSSSTGTTLSGNQFLWTCVNPYSGDVVTSCSAQQSSCGDGFLDASEECDTEAYGCDLKTCTYLTGSCNVTITPSEGIINFSTMYTLTYSGIYDEATINLWNWTLQWEHLLSTWVGNMTATGLIFYNFTWVYTWNLTLYHALGWPNTVCEYTVTADYTACGGPGLIYSWVQLTGAWAPVLCDGGWTATNISYSGSLHRWLWECTWPLGVQLQQVCTADVRYCGDGYVGTWYWFVDQESCDDGGTANGDGCSSTCQYERPECTFTVDPNPTYSWQATVFTIWLTWDSNTWWVNYGYIYYGDNTSPDFGNPSQQNYTHRYQSGGIYSAIFTVYNQDDVTKNQTCFLDVEVAYCGDGAIQWTESCDGANLSWATCQSRGYPGGTLLCNSSCAFDETACLETTSPTVTKTALGPIQWSTWYFIVTWTWLPAVDTWVTTFWLWDQLSNTVTGDSITNIVPLTLSWISTDWCIQLTPTSFECTPTLSNTLSGWTLALLVEVFFAHWGDHRITNTANIRTTVGANDYVGSPAVAFLEWYDLTIDKRYYTWYDSNDGWPLNTYPEARLLSGDIDDGDWVVYRVEVTNNADEDAWSPVVTDTLGTGLTIVDILSETYTSTAIPSLVRAPWTSSWTTNFTGKFEVWASYTVEFSATFNASGAWVEVCNLAEVQGATIDQERNDGDNESQVCLDVLPCDIRACEAEIYAVDIVTDTSVANVFTAEWFCRVEGTCGLSDYIPMDGVSLTYGTCTGNYVELWWWNIIINTLHGTDAYSATVSTVWWYIDEIILQVETRLNGGYEFANTAMFSITNTYPWGWDFSYECRYGDPYLTCDQQTCNAALELDQSWTVGGNAWTPYTGLIATLPESDEAWVGNAEIIWWELFCNTCGDNGTGWGGDPIGECGTATEYYTWVVPTEADACAWGVMTGLNQIENSWTWQCVGEQTTAWPCTATIKWCGDGDSTGTPDVLSWSVEECDYWSGVNGTNGCSVTCEFEEVLCTSIQWSGMNWPSPVTLTWTFGWWPNGWYQYSWLNRGDGSPVINPVNTWVAYATSYVVDGEYTASVVVFNPLNPLAPDYLKTCERVLVVSSVDEPAVCGTASGANYYGENYIPNQLTASHFCGIFQLESLPTPLGNGTYEWTCDGLNGGASITCQANEYRCSDGIIQSGWTYANNPSVTPNESCDDGNEANGDGCNAACQEEDIVFTLLKEEVSFIGSLITYRVSGTVSAGTWSFTLTDLLTTGAWLAEITGSIVPTLSWPLSIVSWPTTWWGDSRTVTVLKDAPLNQSGTFAFEFTVYADHWGDKEICDEVTLTPSVGPDIVRSVCSDGYDVQVEKRVLTGYDSLNGVTWFNTYPSTRLSAATLADGDRLVYEVVVSNNGPEDAWGYLCKKLCQ